MISTANSMAGNGRAALTTLIIGIPGTPEVKKEIQPDRRRDYPDLHFDQHDDAQMDWIDTQLDRNREHQWCLDDQEARGFHELTTDQQD